VIWVQRPVYGLLVVRRAHAATSRAAPIPPADQAAGNQDGLLSYKASWYGAALTVTDRFYPSTRRCSACGVTGDELPLSELILIFSLRQLRALDFSRRHTPRPKQFCWPASPSTNADIAAPLNRLLAARR
jgi:hypothetical protein